MLRSYHSPKEDTQWFSILINKQSQIAGYVFCKIVNLRDSFVISFRFNVHNLRARINIRDRFRQNTHCAHDHNNTGHKWRPTEQKTVWCLHLIDDEIVKVWKWRLRSCSWFFVLFRRATPCQEGLIMWFGKAERLDFCCFSFSSIKNIF